MVSLTEIEGGGEGGERERGGERDSVGVSEVLFSRLERGEVVREVLEEVLSMRSDILSLCLSPPLPSS